VATGGEASDVGGRGWAAVLMVVGMFGCDAVVSASEPDLAHVHFAPGRERQWVRLAVDGAARRFANPGCERLLDEFSDDAGRSLRQHLEEQGQTFAEHLHTVWFMDGRGLPACQQPNRTAFSTPGGRLVFICGEAFRRPADSYHELLVIHEVLHTLGLGENPPTSEYISKAVARRCSAS
jgi:hypothetical protein